jgi:hypothetical protein
VSQANAPLHKGEKNWKTEPPVADPDTPDWVRDAIFYQIFPDRFARSLAVKKPRHLDE